MPRRAMVAGSALLPALVGCSSQSTADANQAYCDAVATAQAEVADLKSLILGGGATVEQVQDQVDKIRDATAQAREQASGLTDAVRCDVESAEEAFTDAVGAIDDDAQLSQALSRYRQAISDWEASVAGIREEVGC